MTGALVRVTGTVQGVGFRPYVHRLASRLGLVGDVANGASGVVIRVFGAAATIEEFVRLLQLDPPPLARIGTVLTAPLEVPSVLRPRFRIVASEDEGSTHTALVPPDVAVCADCLREMQDPADRRFRHPLINCTNCGPRFTIVRAIPYDRASTTMAPFAMCAACAEEYGDPTSRRFHAEAICCPSCGPRLTFSAMEPGVVASDDDGAALRAASDLLRSGGILAVKAIGGYQLAVVAGYEAAVRRLRARKQREEKPLAVMGASIEALRHLVELDETAVALLTSPEAPIVLAARRTCPDAVVAAAVAPDNTLLGVMLPSTGLHHLLLELVGMPLVMTSGNISDEPVVFDDAAAKSLLSAVADGILSHDREIHRRADDSVVRHGSAPAILRRARGFALRPIGLPADGPPVLAVGAELKNTVCFARGVDAFVSPHLGDLEFVDTYTSFVQTIADLERLLAVRPEFVAHDLHPEYLSTKWANTGPTRTMAVQHHHAHVASCMVDNGVTEPVIGVAFDGHGYGPDGSLWGGEFLVADLAGYERVAHLATVALPGGTTAIRQPWRMAVAHLTALFAEDMPGDVAMLARNDANWRDVASLARHAGTLRTSSVGRLFDAVAALLGVRDYVSFEGQAAMALEQAALRHRVEHGSRAEGLLAPFEVQTHPGTLVLHPGPLLRSLVARRNTDTDAVAWEFHVRLADAVCAIAVQIRETASVGVVALTGGVFQNALLTQLTRDRLLDHGFRVLVHRQVPANDGGISLGQAAIARARLTKGDAAWLP